MRYGLVASLLHARDASYQQCLTELYIDTNHGSAQLWIKRHCGANDPGDFKQVLPGLPADFVQIEQDFDLAAGMATVTVTGRPPVVLGLGLTAAGGSPVVDFGMLGTGGTGPELAFDDFVVTAR